MKPKIIGKYKITDPRGAIYTIRTDNPIEAVWEANKGSNRTIHNICGEREFYKDADVWKIKPL